MSEEPRIEETEEKQQHHESALTKERKPPSQMMTVGVVAATVLLLFIIAFYAYGAAQNRERNALIERMTNAIAASSQEVALRRASEANDLAASIRTAGDFGHVTFVFRNRVIGTTDRNLDGQQVDWSFPPVQEGARVSRVDGKTVVDHAFASGTEEVGGMRIVIDP